jgi:hypothetical protein
VMAYARAGLRGANPQDRDDIRHPQKSLTDAAVSAANADAWSCK